MNLQDMLSPRLGQALRPNVWDVVALILVIGAMVLIVYGGEQTTLPLSTLDTTPVSLDPANLPFYALRTTMRMLLAHSSGLPAYEKLFLRAQTREELLALAMATPLASDPGSVAAYSDIGFIALGEVVARVGGLPLDQFAKQNIFVPLGMTHTGFQPNAVLNSKIAPTEKRRGQMSYLGDSGTNAGAEGEVWLRGQVHDPTSYRMNGVAGHAGLFSTANDLAIYSQMLLNGGSYGGVRILAPLTVAEMTRPRIVTSAGGTRGLGWDMNTSFSTNRGELFPLGSFGHTGFTGTSIWIDPAGQTAVIFLSNRVHPKSKGNINKLRGEVATLAAAACKIVPE